MSIGNGGKAFPSGLSGGMSLRDYFAAKAVVALLSDFSSKKSISEFANEKGLYFADVIAGQAYDLADAMLAARGDV